MTVTNNTKMIKKIPVQAKSAIVFMIANFCNMGFNFLATPFFTRIMTESEIGITNVFETWRSILSVIVTLNLFGGVFEVYLFQHDQDKERMQNSLILVTSILCLFFFVIVLLFNEVFSKLFKLRFCYLIILCFEIYSMSVVSFWITRKRFEYDYKSYGVVIVCISFLKMLLSILGVIVFPDNRVLARLLGWAIPYYILAIILLICRFKRNKGFSFTKYALPAISYNIVLVPHYLSSIALGSADKIIISRIVSDSATGVYSISVACSSAVAIIISSITNAFTPFIYSKFKLNEYSVIKKYSSFLNYLIIAIALTASLVGPELFMLLAPTNYYGGIKLLPSLIAGVYFASLYSYFSSVEFFYKYNRLTSIATLVGAALNIVLNYLLIPVFGYEAAAYTTLGSYMVMAGMHLVFYRYISKKEGIHAFDLKKLIISALVYFFISIMMIAIYDYKYIRLSIAVAVLFLLIVMRKKIILIVKNIRVS